MTDTPLDTMAPISLAETVDQAALLHRMDTKYLADDATVADLMDRLGPSHRVLEIDGQRSFGYHSRYLDSPDLRSFRWHVQGRRRRFKARIRHYLDSGDRLLEVKTRGSRGETVKFRTECADGDVGPAHSAFVAMCLNEAYRMSRDADLSPILDVVYTRTTLVARTGATRVTLDRALSFHDLSSGRAYGLPACRWLVETKSAQGRSEADRALLAARVRPLSVSKYILGLALTRPDLQVNAYLPIIRGLSAVPIEAASAHQMAVAA